jgi:hypothetical protein
MFSQSRFTQRKTCLGLPGQVTKVGREKQRCTQKGKRLGEKIEKKILSF